MANFSMSYSRNSFYELTSLSCRAVNELRDIHALLGHSQTALVGGWYVGARRAAETVRRLGAESRGLKRVQSRELPSTHFDFQYRE